MRVQNVMDDVARHEARYIIMNTSYERSRMVLNSIK